MKSSPYIHYQLNEETRPMKDAGIGIDLGSSSVRVGLFTLEDDLMVQCVKQKISYYYHGDSALWEYTQSTDEIMKVIERCLHDLKIDEYNIKSCGVSATCSMALFIKEHNHLEPFNTISGSHRQNVIFWMDNSSKTECKLLNNLCEKRLRDFMGGKFIPEMGIPKINRLINYLKSSDDLQNLSVVAMDLHRYLAYEIAKRFKWNFDRLLNTTNFNEIGHDGELSGWSSKFYIDTLKIPSNITIGPEPPLEDDFEYCKGIVASCIDCYSSWLSLCSPTPEESLFIVGGTSTCYLYATTRMKTIPGVWGPFTDILDNSNTYAVYEGGQSCTGKLIEHLLQTHPASSSIAKDDWPLLLEKIEQEISAIEEQTGRSIHFKTKHMFFYGDFQGNRTPYADPEMSGMTIGETTDVSFNNLILRYICILEFLAFQIKYMISIFNKAQGQDKITEIRICGSQAKNKRLLSLISLLHEGGTIKLPKTDVELSGVSGAFLLGKSALLNKSPLDLIQEKDDQKQVDIFETPSSINQPLSMLLEAKYEIHLDMAKQQLIYREMINKIPEISEH